MPSTRVSLAVALAAAAAAVCVDGFQVAPSPVQAMDPTEPHRVLQQWFTVDQDSLDALFNHETLQTLKISIPGRVFVSYNHEFGPSVPVPGPAQAATVRISGNAPQIFDFFEVVATAPHEIEVRRRPTARGGLDEAFMLTEISVTARHQISQIISTGPADLVIEDGVLIDSLQSKLKLQLRGSGNVYMDTRSSALAAGVEVDCSGSADLYWRMSSLQTPSLKVAMAGSGDLNIIGAGVDLTTMDVALAGSGDTCFEATSFKTDTMKIVTLGSGEASISTVSGRCNREEIVVLGSGDATLGGVQCNDAKVNIMGSGDVYIQAVNTVAGQVWGPGDVKYIGSRPALISDRHDDHAFSTEQKKKYKPIAVPAVMTPAVACRVGSPPGRVAVHVTMYSSFGAGVGLGPLIFFAIISLCYLCSQRKTKRARAARFGDYTHASELHPLVTASAPQFGSMAPPPQQQQQQQQQLQQSQVYV